MFNGHFKEKYTRVLLFVVDSIKKKIRRYTKFVEYSAKKFLNTVQESFS
jgi:hypothetical protein